MILVSFTVSGPPVGVNRTYERRSMWRGGRGMKLTVAALDYRARVQLAAVLAMGYERCTFARPLLTVCGFFTRGADCDALAKPVQDALSGIAYDDDRRVFCAINWDPGIDRSNPRTEIWIREVTDEDLQRGDLSPLPIPAGAGGVALPAGGPRRKEHSSPRLVSSVRRFGE